MKVISKKTFRKKSLLVLVPVVFMFLLLVATSGQVAVGAHYVPAYNVPPPGPFPPAPLATDDNDGDSVSNFDGYVDVAELLGSDYLGDPANQGSVHIIDVRSSFEYLADVCPMQIALGMPVYPTTNVGHPAWNWADPTDTSPATGTQYEEAYSNPYWIGFYFAGSPGVPENIRMEENPDFHSYAGYLASTGIGATGDKLVILCQTGYRASFAAMEIKAMGIGSEVVVLYGGELAWRDDWSLDDNDPTDVDGDLNTYPDMDINCDANDSSDPSPDDDPANPNTPPYVTPVPWPNGTWKDCDPDDTPGPASLGYTNTLSSPWEYDATALGTQYVDYMWNGTEPHVAVKPWWQSGMGADDSWLALSGNWTSWVSPANYMANLLTVSYQITNNPPMDVTPVAPGSWPADPDGVGPLGPRDAMLPFPWSYNYAVGCTDYGAPGSGCEPVGQAAHGTAYNTMIVDSDATNSVMVVPASLPGWIGPLAANASGNTTVQYTVPPGTPNFIATVFAISTDLVDPTDTWPSGYNDAFHTPLMCPAFGSCAWPWPATGMGWYGMSQYPGPATP